MIWIVVLRGEEDARGVPGVESGEAGGQQSPGLRSRGHEAARPTPPVNPDADAAAAMPHLTRGEIFWGATGRTPRAASFALIGKGTDIESHVDAVDGSFETLVPTSIEFYAVDLRIDGAPYPGPVQANWTDARTLRIELAELHAACLRILDAETGEAITGRAYPAAGRRKAHLPSFTDGAEERQWLADAEGRIRLPPAVSPSDWFVTADGYENRRTRVRPSDTESEITLRRAGALRIRVVNWGTWSATWRLDCWLTASDADHPSGLVPAFDATGCAVVAGLPAGDYDVSLGAQSPGRTRPQVTAVHVDAGTTRDITLRLPYAGSAAGSLRIGVPSTSRHRDFRIRGVEARTLGIRRELEVLRAGKSEFEVRVPLPGVYLLESQSTPWRRYVELTEDSDVVRVSMPPLSRVSLRIIDAASNRSLAGLADVHLRLLVEEKGDLPMAWGGTTASLDRESWCFECDAPLGTYEVRVYADGYLDGGGVIEVTDARRDPDVLGMEKPSRLTVRVGSTDGAVGRELQDALVTLQNADDDELDSENVDPDGVVVFDDLYAGTYKVQVTIGGEVRPSKTVVLSVGETASLQFED